MKKSRLINQLISRPNTPTDTPINTPTQNQFTNCELEQIDKQAVEDMAYDICTNRAANFADGCRVCSYHENCLYQNIAYDLYRRSYRKQSENLVEVVRCYDCKYCEVVINDITEEPKYFCTRMLGSMPVDPTDYCSGAKVKGGKG